MTEAANGVPLSPPHYKAIPGFLSVYEQPFKTFPNQFIARFNADGKHQ